VEGIGVAPAFDGMGSPGRTSALRAVVINEVLFNPPGTDIPNEYIELRGSPHALLPVGTFLVVVEGDTNGKPRHGPECVRPGKPASRGNGFLLLLQKTNSYSTTPGAAVLVNTGNGEGFGSGSSSSIHHQGDGGQTDLENGSSTILLVHAPGEPPVGADIDVDNDGLPDGTMFSQWTVLDSVGVLDNDGLGDIAYGAINFAGTARRRQAEPSWLSDSIRIMSAGAGIRWGAQHRTG